MNAFKFIKADFKEHLLKNKIEADQSNIKVHFDKYFNNVFKQIEFETKSDGKA